MAAPAFSAVGSLTSISNTQSVTRPSVSDGDVMLLVLVGAYGDADITAPAGWTEIQAIDQESAFEPELRVYYKVASSEPSTYSITIAGQGGGNNFGTATVVAFTGANTGTPVDVSASQRNTSSSTSAQCPSVTTTQADTLLVAVYLTTNNGASTWTPPSGMTEQLDSRVTPDGHALGIATETIAASGATGTRTATSTVSAASLGVSIALAPSGGGGGGGGQPPRSMHLSRLMRA